MALLDAGLYSRYRHLLPELLKFGVVGGIGAVIDLGGAAVLHKHHVNPLEAKAISTAVATVVTYLGSRFWTFKHRENQALGREAALFIVLNVAGLLIAEAVIALVTYGFGLRSGIEYNAASVIGTGLATIFRYFAYRQWVFTAPAAEAAVGSAASPATEPFPDYPPWELDPAYLAAAAASGATPGVSPVSANGFAAPNGYASPHGAASPHGYGRPNGFAGSNGAASSNGIASPDATTSALDAVSADASMSANAGVSSDAETAPFSPWDPDAEQRSWAPAPERREPWMENQATLPIDRQGEPLLAGTGPQDIGAVDPGAGPRGRHRRP
jgi:putative flippase GtrA